MSYNDLLKIEDIFVTKDRLRAHAKYYLSKDIDGLNYVYHDRESNTIALCLPNNRTNHVATSYLLRLKNKESINTVRRHAYAIKKLLDFLLIWDIDLKEVDLLYLMQGFVSYLRCIETNPVPRFESGDFFYSTLKKIPLNDSALSCGKVVTIGYDKDGFMNSNNWSSNSYGAIKSILSVAILYITFLKEKTKEFENIDLNTLPRKKVNSKHSLLSGTLGSSSYYKVDLDYILNESGFKEPQKKPFENCVGTDVLLLDEVDMLIESIPQTNHQNRLLFTVLKCFGLRAGEAANLEIDTSEIAKNLIYMDKSEAIKQLKENLNGDIRFDKKLKKWICYVVPRDENDRFDTQTKTGGRAVHLVMPNSDFEEHLRLGIIHRNIIMNSNGVRHDKLFIKVSNQGEGGEPITGSTINSRFSYLAEKLNKHSGYDLTDFSPHDIRHFYATHLITNLGYSVFDVSKLLGHANVDTTIQRYYHFIDSKKLDDETKEIYDKFKEKELINK